MTFWSIVLILLLGVFLGYYFQPQIAQMLAQVSYALSHYGLAYPNAVLVTP